MEIVQTILAVLTANALTIGFLANVYKLTKNEKDYFAMFWILFICGVIGLLGFAANQALG
jgi:hypothetical protein